jgi:hypothetical protein
MGYVSTVQQSSPFNQRRTDLQEGTHVGNIRFEVPPVGIVGVFIRLQKSAPILHHSVFFARGEIVFPDPPALRDCFRQVASVLAYGITLISLLGAMG